MKTFSFIFPVHNEADFLGSRIEEFVKTALERYKNKFEIILIENGSSDNSWKIVKKLENKFEFVRAHRLPNPSYGSAIRWGIINSIGKKIFVLNVDYFDFDFIKKADALLNTIDLVIGSKTLSNSNDQRSVYRRLGTYLFNVFIRLILNYPGTDTHGIKAFIRSKKLIDFSKTCHTQNELFDTELVIRLTRSGAIFVDLPQQVYELRPSRYFGLRRLKSTFSDFFSIVKTKYFSKKNFMSSLIDADDFGFSDKVNKAILNGVEDQALDVVSIMPNLVKKKDANLLKNEGNRVAFAMHFNLLRGKPSSNPKNVSSLLDSRGFFHSLPIFILRLNLGLINLEEVKKEFHSQYHQLKKIGIEPTYLNSEQHVHIFSPISILLEEEIHGSSIKKIRSTASSFNSLDGKLLRKTCLIILKNICNFRFGKFDEFNKKYDAYIVHPGSN